jgi:hypothetical protein
MMEKQLSLSSLYVVPASPILVGGKEVHHPAIQKFLHALYPEHSFQSISTPPSQVDTYVIIHLFSYGAETPSLFIQAIQEGEKLFERAEIHPEARLVLIFYCNLPVAFPERKLQREKEMSTKAAEEFLTQKQQKKPIYLVHEFGTAHLEDSLEVIQGKCVYIEGKVWSPL